MYVNGEYRSPLFTSDTQCVQYIGTFDAGQEIQILVQSQAVVKGIIRQLDTDVLQAAIDVLKASELAVETYDNRTVTGSVTAEDGDVLFTTIPYDTGWTVYIDGEKAETTTFASALMAVPLTAGVHEIELVYTAPKLVLGMAISLGSGLIFLFGYCLRENAGDPDNSKRRLQSRWRKETARRRKIRPGWGAPMPCRRRNPESAVLQSERLDVIPYRR